MLNTAHCTLLNEKHLFPTSGQRYSWTGHYVHTYKFVGVFIDEKLTLALEGYP